MAFGRRVASLIERIANELDGREARAGDPELALAGAPREIRAVAEAIETTLRETHREVDRARLLSAGLAHDLRAPVQTLLTSTQVALLGPLESGDARPLLEEHLSELRALARTIDNLVTWGSPRVERGEVARVRFDLAGELESRLTGEEEEAALHGVFLDVMREGDLELEGYPSALVLALRNLVSNAIRWSPPEGQVSVRLEGQADRIVVSVEDEGPGVPPGERERIFEPFVRGAAAPGRRAGYGLGLAIVTFVASDHGGSVRVTQRDEGGARFTMTLPRTSQRG